jgi:hypothetical protein
MSMVESSCEPCYFCMVYISFVIIIYLTFCFIMYMHTILKNRN